MSYIYILGTIIFTVSGQLLVKWRIGHYGSLPENFFKKVIFLLKLVFDPFIFLGLAGAFIAALFWLAALTKLDLSYAYPFVGITFILILFFSAVLFNEPFNLFKALGIIYIILGIIISSRSL